MPPTQHSVGGPKKIREKEEMKHNKNNTTISFRFDKSASQHFNNSIEKKKQNRFFFSFENYFIFLQKTNKQKTG